MSTPIAITTNPHDHGYDIVAGHDVTGRVIGSIYMQAPHQPDDDQHGLVLEFIEDHEQQYLPDSARDAARIIREETGRELTTESINDIETLS